MGWRDRLQPASYRGRPFFVSRATRTAGRRIVSHEFAQRETPYLEDTGRRARSFTLEGYLLGDDYDKDLAGLVKVCERPSAGYPWRIESLLVHPYLGRLKVACQAITTEEDSQVGRFARVKMTFLEAGDPPEPTIVANPSGQVAAAGASLVETAGQVAGAGLEVSSVPAAVTDAVSKDVSSLAATLAGLDIFTGPAESAAAMATKIRGLVDSASTLATSPLELVAAIAAAISTIAASTESALGALHAYEALLGSPSSSGSSIAPTSTVEALVVANSGLVAGAVVASALAGAASSAAAVDWKSYDDALEVRGRLIAAVEARMTSAGDLEYARLEGVRSAIVAAVPPPSRALPRVSRETLQTSLPALVVAYRLYGSTDRADDLAERNHARHESFLPAGVELEVLTDAIRT